MKNDLGSLKGVRELHELSCFHRFIDYLLQGYNYNVVNVQIDGFVSARVEWKPLQLF